MADLRVTLVQTSLVWHNPEANRQQLQQKIAQVAGQSDLVVLPEMFTSGFTTHPEDFSPERSASGSDTTDWMLQLARQYQLAIAGSVATKLSPVADQAPYVNRLFFVTPSGELMHYDKVHLFRMGDEHKRYRPGKQRFILDYQGWRLLLTVCYDLRFPVFCRNRNDYDVMLNVANWPDKRQLHWRTLLQARAIENQVYVVGVNRVGTDGKGWNYLGDSMVIDPQGERLVDQPGEWVKTVSLSQQRLQDYRREFPVYQDADNFSLKV